VSEGVGDAAGHSGRGRDPVGWFGRGAGPLLALAVYAALGYAEGLAPEGRVVAACGVLMAVFWMTEAMPLAATSLLPLLLFPLFGTLSFAEAAAPYANKYIFLFLGGFMLAAAIERWDLHRRIALHTVLAAGTGPARLVGGFMVATALLSMWISNTATTMLMLPIATSTIQLLGSAQADSPGQGRTDRLATCLLLGVAYAASIGGIGTLVGTPPNAFLAGFLESHGMAIGFAQWMLLGVPLATLLLAIAWWVLTRWLFRLETSSVEGGRQLIGQQLAALGSMSRGEVIVLGVFLTTAAMWIGRGLLVRWDWFVGRFPAIGNLNDAMIALGAALALFLIPVDRKRGIFALDWPSASHVPWGVLLLFGGGLSLAEAMTRSGLTEWIGGLVGQLGGLPQAALVVVTVGLVILLTEITSNLATTAALVPILYGVAMGLDVQPMGLLVPAAIAASCAFMLPVATPPNAIVFGSGRVTIGQMVRAGIWLNVVGVVVIPVFVQLVGAWLLGAR